MLLSRILIAEDEGPKLANVRTFVEGLLRNANIKEARSVRSTVDLLRSWKPNLLLLDMSLPTFDIRPGEPGGRPQGFGGIEVLRIMGFEERVVPVVVITAYEAYNDRGIDIGLIDLSVRLSKDHPGTFRGLVYYNSVVGGWQEKLSSYIELVQQEFQ